MRVGFFGGSFDPIHFGHLRPVRTARETLGLDQIIYLPTARPPHKPDREFAPAYARYTMVELAVLDEEGLVVSPFEMTFDRPAFTIDTLEHYQREMPGAELSLLLGCDAFAALDSWKRWREIVALARLVVLARPGWETTHLAQKLPPPIARLAESPRVRFLTNPPVEISSTELRSLLARGERVPSGVMPDLVVKYIEKYSLYR